MDAGHLHRREYKRPKGIEEVDKVEDQEVVNEPQDQEVVIEPQNQEVVISKSWSRRQQQRYCKRKRTIERNQEEGIT